jgi:S1-C subfamily serine protease
MNHKYASGKDSGMEEWTDSSYDPEPETEPQPAKRGLITKGRLILLFVLGFFVMVAVWVLVLQSAGGITGVMDLLFGSSSEMVVSIQAPPSVNVGDEVALVINVQNLGEGILEIEEILVPKELLEAAVVTSIFPGSTNQRERGGMTAFEIGYAITPLESLSFTINLQAVGPIDFQGELEVKSGWRREQAGTRVVIIGPGGVAGTGPGLPGSEFGPNVPYRSVVKISARHSANDQMVESWSGSGSIISADGLILTNAHVVLPGHLLPVDELVIYLTTEPDQPPTPMYHAEVLQADPLLDLAVIRITTDLNGAPVDRNRLNLPTVELGDPSALELGDPLTILGYPGIGGDTITLTQGSVSGFTGEEGYGDRAFIKTSATIAGGNSGGLVADESGMLIAIPTQIGSGGEGDVVDCRAIADTNRDGVVNSLDTCVPTGGFINALRPIDFAQPLIEAASRGEVNIVELPKPDISLPVGDLMLASDDFSISASGWDHGSGSESFVGYNNGEYHVEVDAPNYVAWGLSHGMFVDTVITVQARVVRPVGNADFGVICRYRDADNFYAFSITEDRFASIWMVADGEYSVLMDWTFSQDIPRYEIATITVACLSNELTLAVNGVVLGRVLNFSFASGDIGLFGGAWTEPGFTVAFDNIEIKSP